VAAWLRRELVAAAAAGIAFGLGARAKMRIVAWTAGLDGSFSWGGSIEVVIGGLLIGAPLALVYAVSRPYLPRRAGWWAILVGSTGFLALALLPPPAASSALAATPDRPVVTAVLFWLLMAAFGAGLEWRWRRRSREPR
jgi:hypothetical protein